MVNAIKTMSRVPIVLTFVDCPTDRDRRWKYACRPSGKKDLLSEVYALRPFSVGLL